MRNVVITGANSGIGLETAVALAAAGDRVVMCCRDPQRGAAALEEVRTRTGTDTAELVALDLGSLASIRTAAADLDQRLGTIDVLINNAGALLSDRRVTEDGFEATFGVNHLGHFELTNLLEGPIRRAAEPRVINLSSLAHWYAPTGIRWKDPQFERWYRPMMAYAQSKLANLMHARELARRWPDVAANAVHPGVVSTGFAREGDTNGIWGWYGKAQPKFGISATNGAATTIFVATDPAGRHTTGQYFVNSKVALSAPWSKRPADLVRLWDLSAELVG